jgi:hypothetical protein
MMSYLLVSINKSVMTHKSKHTYLFVVPGRFGGICHMKTKSMKPRRPVQNPRDQL